MYLMSLLSPISMFLTYYFNACIAHNLYVTFYTYKSNYEKRIKFYLCFAVIMIMLILTFSVISNNGVSNTTIRFTITYYTYNFLQVAYIIGLMVIIYIIFKVIYVLNRKEEFFSFLNGGSYEYQRRELIILFVRRHITFLVIFVVCYLPNNIIQVIQTFLPDKICVDCQGYSIFVYLMSLSCTFTFILKMTEPYMRKYLKTVFFYIFRSSSTQV